MVAMLVASSTATATVSAVRRRDRYPSSSRPQQLVYVCSNWKKGVIGTTSARGHVRVASSSRASCSPLVVRSTMTENPTPQKHEQYTVGDYMTSASELYCAKEDTTVDEALEVLVSRRITGMPVVDNSGVLGLVFSGLMSVAYRDQYRRRDKVSDSFSVLYLNGQRPAETSLFPEAGRTWKAFKEIQRLLIKTNGKTVGDVMTPTPLVVHEHTNLEDAARILLDTKFRRLPVLDGNGKLVGLLTRGNVVQAALAMKRDAEKALGGKRAAEEILRDT